MEADEPKGHGERVRLSPVRRAEAVDLVVLSVLASAVSVLGLGNSSLTGDEATSYFIATRSWEDFWASLTTGEANGSLFYALLRIPVAFGSDATVLRLVPALCAIVTVPTLYLVLVRMFGRRTAIMGAVALALNAFFVTHAQNARGYSMAAMFAALATLLFVLALEQPTRLRWTLYVVAGVAGCYSHFFCVFVLVAHVLSLVALPREDLCRRQIATGYAAAAALLAPLAYILLTNDRGQVDWIPDSSAETVMSNLYAFTGQGGPFLAAVVAGCVGLAVSRWIRTIGETGRTYPSWRMTLLLGWLLVPIALTLIGALVKPLFVGRYLLPALPALAGAVAVGLGMLRWRFAAAVAAVAMLVLFAVQLPGSYSAARPGWAARADLVVANAAPGDAVALYAPTSIRPFGYYAGYYAERDDGAVAPDPIYPSLDWIGYSQTRYEPDLGGILDAAASHERVWLVIGNAEDDERRAERVELVTAFDEACARVPGFTGTVRLYENCRAALSAL